MFPSVPWLYLLASVKPPCRVGNRLVTSFETLREEDAQGGVVAGLRALLYDLDSAVYVPSGGGDCVEAARQSTAIQCGNPLRPWWALSALILMWDGSPIMAAPVCVC